MQSAALDATEAFSAARSTHPRVTLQSMKDKITFERYITAGEALHGAQIVREGPGAVSRLPLSLEILTICILVMENGFVLIGKSAPASPENFDEEKGRTFAYEDAIKQLWPLEAYALRDELTRAGKAEIQPHDGMAQFVGTKIVNARPMTRSEYNVLRGWTLPEDENGDDAGYLIEYADGQRPNVAGFLRYVSWSPADVFEAAYRGPGFTGQAIVSSAEHNRSLSNIADQMAPTQRDTFGRELPLADIGPLTSASKNPTRGAAREIVTRDVGQNCWRNSKGDAVPDSEVIRSGDFHIRIVPDTELGQVAGKLIGHDRSEEGAPSFKG